METDESIVESEQSAEKVVAKEGMEFGLINMNKL